MDGWLRKRGFTRKTEAADLQSAVMEGGGCIKNSLRAAAIPAADRFGVQLLSPHPPRATCSRFPHMPVQQCR